MQCSYLYTLNTIHCSRFDSKCYKAFLTVTFSFDFLGPPIKATSVNTEVVVALNKSTTLECFVAEDDQGYPDYYFYVWTRDNDFAFNVSTTNGALTLTPHDTNCQDIYSCHPHNIAGIGQEAHIFLKIKGRQ